MKNCMDAIVDWMINCNVIDESEKELYQYAVHSFLLSLAPLLLAGGIGFCMGNVWQGIFIVIPFIFLRKFSGGYHAKNVWICLVVSCLLLFLCIMLSTYVKCDEVLIMLTFLAVIILSVFSPIENENKVLNQEEKTYIRKK